MFERYSERARRVVFYAKAWAAHRGASEIEPRDLFLGATHDKHQAGCPFEKLHEEAAMLRELLVPSNSLGLNSVTSVAIPVPNRDLPLSATGKMALAYAAQEAERDRRYTIGSDHLVRGILHTPDEVVEQLNSAGYTLAAMRIASKTARKLNPVQVAPLRWWLRRYWWVLVILVGSTSVLLAALYMRTQQ